MTTETTAYAPTEPASVRRRQPDVRLLALVDLLAASFVAEQAANDNFGQRQETDT